MAAMNDDQLLEAARAGDTDALERLLERHQDSVYRFGMKMCRDPEDARDVLQDTLLAAARSVRDFRGASSLSTWLYTIARSFCIKHRRKSKFAPDQHESLEGDAAHDVKHLPHPDRTPDEAAVASQVRDALESAIRDLEPEQRETLLLRDVEGLKATEVAEVLGISVPAVKSRLHRARVNVRDAVAPLLGIPDGLPTAAGVCPDVLTLYSQHVEGEISTELCAEMEAHLASCPRCQSTCDSLKETLALCSRLPPAPVPGDVQESVKTALRRFLRAPAGDTD